MDLEQELATILDALHSADVEYALCGGLALAVHGEITAPPQVDLLLAPRSADVAEPFLRSLGYSARAPLQYESAAAVLPISVLPLSADAPAWQRRIRVLWRQREIEVLAMEDAETMKAQPTAARGRVDMSAEAITSRIRQASQLRKLCLSLGKAKPANQPPPPRG